MNPNDLAVAQIVFSVAFAILLIIFRKDFEKAVRDKNKKDKK